MFENTSYFPALTTRAGELGAYQECFDPVKDAMVPIFTLTRYAETESLADSAAALVEALGGRRSIVDFDSRPRPITSLAEAAERRRRKNLRKVEAGEKESRPRSERELANDAERLRKTEAFNRELSNLLEPSQGPSRWLQLLGAFPELVPVLRLNDQLSLRIQLQSMIKNERVCAIRLRASEAGDRSIVLGCADVIAAGASRLVLIVDAGNIWGRADGSTANVLEVLRELRTGIGEGFDRITKIVLSTSFPRQPLRSVSPILSITDLQLHHNVAKEFEIRFGDYGSLPNRVDDSMARGWFSHVDLVTPANWHVALYENNRDFSKYVNASIDIIADAASWRLRADCWGTSVIEQVSRGNHTVEGRKFTHPAPWLTVRINQHLSQMALRRG
ncbi:hypothetical protein H4S14_002463 [Agrobacterium vitis]|nr:hypothetical protein [Agrobacterium vitis]MBE1438707.1 hypothetical protein [Agrobacterium vitis]